MHAFKNLAHILKHVAVVVLGAAIALSLPYTVKVIARKFLVYWTLIENEKIFLVSIEIAAAVLLIIIFNSIGRGLRERKLSKAAGEAGLRFAGRAGRFIDRTRLKRMKAAYGFGRDVMLIGSTGFRTFTDTSGDLHEVIKNCREAKILLLDPFSEGASERAKGIGSPYITMESFGEQIMASIDFLKGLRAVRKNIRLKLYFDTPLLKLAILGDYAFMRHYHEGLDVQDMPEFVFGHGRRPGGLYNAFYQYFLDRWHDPGIPEYELETDELIYRDKGGNEIRREKFLREAVEWG